MSEEDTKLVYEIIENEKETFQKLSMEIWANPELCYNEFHAHSVLTEALENFGFAVTRSYVTPTAFRAEYSRGVGSVVAVLCEYDALPDIGHACGHNLIAEAGIATAAAIKAVLDEDHHLNGKVVVLGCPAEEGGGGKIRLIEAGAFDDMDAALMVHPSRRHVLAPIHSCREKMKVVFEGKAADSSIHPWRGLNALDAAISAYVAIGLLRQQIKPTCRIHGVIKRGGTDCAVIPEQAEMHFFVRAPTEAELISLRKRITCCFESAARTTGCTLQLTIDHQNTYLNLITNPVLSSLFKNYSRPLGIEFDDEQPVFDPLAGGGSSDVGNVSYRVPTIQAVFKTGPHKIHTKQFREQAAMPAAHQAARQAAKALALTAIRLMRCPQLVYEAKLSFIQELQRNEKLL